VLQVGDVGDHWFLLDVPAGRLLKNYLRCHRCVKNRLVRESDQNAHLQLVNSAFSPFFCLALTASPTFLKQPVEGGYKPRLGLAGFLEQLL
jgi:hypothetical protein